MIFLKNFKVKAKRYIGISFSLMGAFAILKSDLITENICNYLERKCKSHISNPLNSKDILEEKYYIKNIVRKKINTKKEKKKNIIN
jgi:hypothetical protein